MVDSPKSLIETVHLLLHLISGDGIHLGFSEATIPLRLIRQGCHKVLGHYRNSPDRRYNRAPDHRDSRVPSHRENALSCHKGRLLIQDINVLSRAQEINVLGPPIQVANALGPLIQDINALGLLIKGINVLDPLIQDLNGLDLLVSLRLRKRISLPGVNRNGPGSTFHH